MMGISRNAPLKALFAATLLFRVYYVFLHSPLKELFSDPLRHWLNGGRFFAPDVMGSSDPPMYQVWVYLLRTGTGGNEYFINLITGLLSALLPWLWYRALREILPRRQALFGGILIALTPSFIMIYGYFMTETLVMPLMAAGCWLSLRAGRKGTLSSWTLAALCWALACYTRLIALPAATIMLAATGLACRKRMAARSVIVLALFAALAVPACWHSALKLNYCAPFGNEYLNRLYRLSGARTYTIDFGPDGGRGFTSPSMLTHPFEPFSEWQSKRKGIASFHIDLTHGRSDWKAEMVRARDMPSHLSPVEDWRENLAMLFFDPSWPDNNPNYLEGKLNILGRWLWLPLFCYVAWGSVRRNLSRRERILPVVATITMLLLCVQQMGVMEGRYRKPVEPILVASAVILFCRRRRAEQGLHLPRDLTLGAHYVLDQWMPPALRDCRLLMKPLLKLAFGSRAPVYLDFKERAPDMSEEMFRAAYRETSVTMPERATDLNRASVIRILQEVRGPRVLEVGCGRGYLLSRLLEKSYALSACDIVLSPEVRALSPRMDVREASAEALPFSDKAFDTAICTHTLEHVRDLPRAIRELRRVARRIIIVVPRQRPYRYTFDLHLHFFPYAPMLLSAFGNAKNARLEDADGDWFYCEDTDA